jgi:hypothetical protein
VAAAKAAVVQAKLNVDYAAVLSPISGRIGRAEVTEGPWSVRARPRCWPPCSRSTSCTSTSPSRPPTR